MNSWLLAFMVQTAVGRIGGEGKVKLTLTRQIKSNVYTGGNTCQWHVHGDVNITLWLRVSVREPLSSPLVQTAISLTASYLFLCGFKKPIWQRQRANNSLWIVWLLSKQLNKKKKKKKVFSGLTPSLPELCGPSGRRTVPKNVNNASELSAGLNEPFREDGGS